MSIEAILEWFKQYPFAYAALQIFGVILLAYLSYFILSKVLIRFVTKLVKKSTNKIDDVLFNERFLKRVAYLAPLFILLEFAYLIPYVDAFFQNLFRALIAFTIVLAINAILTSLTLLLSQMDRFKDKPIKGYVQVIQLILFIFGAIFVVGLVTGKDPLGMLAGLGALTAVILLIFRDTILSFIASIQIASYDLVKVGDWIEIPSYGVDGDVMDIALHTVKIRNWDQTITVLPTAKLVEVTFKNWRGMQETGGRRIMRSVNIDLESIQFCDMDMLKRFEKFQLLTDYIKEKQEEVKEYNKKSGVDDSQLINGRRLTNLGTFRAYLKAYLRHREDVHKELTFLVRQLPSTAEGVPIQIYVFATTTSWVPYEEIQADIFDHVFAVVPEFELRLYQKPSGNSFSRLALSQQEPDEKTDTEAEEPEADESEKDSDEK